MEPSLNFYLVTHNNTWLAPVTRNTIDLTENDNIYAFENEIREIKKDQYSRYWLCFLIQKQYYYVLIRISSAIVKC